MPFRKEFHDILPLIEEPLSVIELAKAGCLPPVLHINHIAQLLYPDDVKIQEATKVLLKAVIRKNDLNVVTVEEYSRMTMEHEQSRVPKKYKNPEPPGLLFTLSGCAVGYQETDLLPEDEGLDRNKRRMFVVHRDEMKKWLQAENKWPLDKGILLSNWWPVESEGSVQESGAAPSERVSVKELIGTLDEDPIYSNNKRSFLFLREIIPEEDMPPFSPLGRGTYSLLFVLAWASYCKPPLAIYLPGKKESPRLDWEVATKFTDYRSAHGYRIEGSTRFIKFGDFEINIAELRQFLLSHEFCLPAKLFPRDPANCQRLQEIEQAKYERLFQEEVQFSQLLPRFQEDVIEAVRNRQQQPEIESCKRAVRALDDLNALLTKNERTENWQRKRCLSDKCLEAIDYIELRCRPLMALGPPAPPALDNTFRKEGQVWTLCYAGQAKNFNHSKGLLYISYLLGSPYQEYHVAELVKVAEDHEKDTLAFSSGDVLSREAVDQYRERLKQIPAELEAAHDDGNSLLLKELFGEKEAVEKQLMQAIGMGGKLKKHPDEITRQVKAVSAAIGRSLKIIEQAHPTLGQHLKNAIKRGVYLSYNPEMRISWSTIQ